MKTKITLTCLFIAFSSTIVAQKYTSRYRVKPVESKPAQPVQFSTFTPVQQDIKSLEESLEIQRKNRELEMIRQEKLLQEQRKREAEQNLSSYSQERNKAFKYMSQFLETYERVLNDSNRKIIVELIQNARNTCLRIDKMNEQIDSIINEGVIVMISDYAAKYYKELNEWNKNFIRLCASCGILIQP